MIGSVGLFGMIRLKKFAGRAYYRRFITCLPACTLDSGAHRSIGDVPEIPRHQKIDAVRDGDGDMRRIVSGPAWNRTAIDERLRETFGIRGRIEKCDSFKRFESEACGSHHRVGVAFRNAPAHPFSAARFRHACASS